MTLFELAATLTLDTSDFTKQVNKATSVGQGFADTLSQKVTAKTIALGNALYKVAETGVRAMTNLAKSAVTSAAEVRAENARFEATFGILEKTATRMFKTIGADTNILSTRLRTVGTKAFSQFTGAGLGAVDALSAMDTYTRLAADAAAYYDISLEDADTRLRSFIRGNTEAGDAIGLFTSESQRNAYAIEEYGKKWIDLTEAQKQMLMLNVAEDIYAQSGAIGQAKREGDSWTNTVANLQETWRQTLAVIGEPLVDNLTPFVEGLTTKLSDNSFQGNLANIAGKIGEIAGYSLTEVMSGLNTLITGEIDETSSLSQFVGSLQQLSAWCDEHAPFVKEALLAIAGAVAIANAPWTAMIAVVALVALNWDNITTAVDAAYDAVTGFFEAKVAPVWQSVVDGVVTTWNGVTSAISDAIQKLKEFFGMSGGSDVFSDHPAYKGGHGQAAGYGLEDGGSSASAVSFDTDTGLLNKLRGFAVGLDYVPSNNFIARLHEGEAVLTKTEATAWRRGEGQGVTIDLNGLAEALGEVINGRPIAINIDGKAFATLMAREMSRSIGNRNIQTLMGMGG